MVSQRILMRCLFTLCGIFTAILLLICTHYQIHEYNHGGVYIEQTINGQYIVSIRGDATEDIELVKRLLKYEGKLARNKSTGYYLANDTSVVQLAPMESTSMTSEVNYDGITADYSSRPVYENTYEHLEINVTDKLLNFKNYKCPTTLSAKNILNLHICGDLLKVKYKLLFLTTMYYSGANINFFNNTLRVISSMRRDFNVKPVVFIEKPQSFIEANQTGFLEYACASGWTVLLAPHCNKYGFPVFKSMFNVSMETWDAAWYGYSNGDMLFDGSLISTLDFIQSKSNILKIPMLVGRRYTLAIESSAVIRHYSEIQRLHFTSRIDKATAVDYFMTRRGAFPWHDVPDFVVGRPVYDTWMLWFSNHAKLPMVDTTATVRAIHQSIKGLQYVENTHRVRRVKDGMNYNKNLAQALGKTNAQMKLSLRLGYLSCMPLKLIKMEGSILNDMVTKGHTTIVGRGKDHHPVESDDQEYLSAIQLFNQTRAQTKDSITESQAGIVNNDGVVSHKFDDNNYYMNSTVVIGRKLLDQETTQKSTKAKSRNSNVKVVKKKNKETQKVKLQNTKNAQVGNTTQVDVKSNSAENPNLPLYNRTTLKQLNNTQISNFTQTKLENKVETGLVTTNSTQSAEHDSNLTNNIKTKFNSTIKPTTQISREEYIRNLNKERGFKNPAMIPFIGESEAYVYVLVRRTSYLEWKSNGPGFRAVPHMQQCYNKQNIDRELSQLVTF